MAIDWSKYLNEDSSPAGRGWAQQSQGRLTNTQGGWGGALSNADSAYTWSQPRWNTGGQWGSTETGFSNDFYQQMNTQYNEAARGGGYGELYSRSDFTGIMLNNAYTDQQVGQEQGAQAFEAFYEGKKIGNVYDVMGEEDATKLLLNVMDIQPDTIRRSAEARDPWAAARREINRRVEEDTQRITAHGTQVAHQARVEEKQQELMEGGGFQGWSTAAQMGGGALGVAGLGALTASVLAPFTGGGSLLAYGLIAGGAAIGGGLGYYSSQTNVDQASGMVANALVQQEYASEENRSGFFTGLKNWSGIGMQALSPLQGAYHGWYDQQHGAVGDGKSAFYSLNEDGERVASGWAQTVDAALMVGDALMLGPISPIAALGKFGTGAVGKIAANASSMGAYKVTMAGAVVGGAGELATGEVFDDASGTFKNVWEEGPSHGLAQAGAVLIDAAQLGYAQGLTRKFRGSWQKAGGSDVAGVAEWEKVSALGKVRSPKNAAFYQDAGGLRFFKDKEGQLLDKYSRPITTYLAPSELMESVSYPFMAMRNKALASGRAISADSVYRTVMAASTGDKLIARSIINGWGESLEEMTQEVLETYAMGYGFAEWEDIWEAGKAGFTTGLGMSLASGLSSAKNLEQQYHQYLVLNAGAGSVLSKDQFRQLPDTSRNALVLQSPAVAQAMEEAGRNFVNEASHVFLASEPASRAVAESIQAAVDANARKANPAVQSKVIVTGFSDGSARGDAVLLSAASVQRRLEETARQLPLAVGALQKKFEGHPDMALSPTEIAFHEKAVEYSDRVLARVTPLFDEITRAIDSQDQAAFENAVLQVNTILEAAFEGESWVLDGGPGVAKKGGRPPRLSQDERLALQRAVSSLFSRTPTTGDTSLLVLLPQIDVGMTLRGEDYVAHVSNGLTPHLVDGDYDGDRIETNPHLVIDQDTFRAKLTGQEYVDGKGKLLFKMPHATTMIVNDMQVAMRDYDNHAKDTLNTFFKNVEARLYNTLVKTKALKRTEFQGLMRNFRPRVESGGIKGVNKMLETLASEYHTQLSQAGRSSGRNLYRELVDALMREVADWQTAYSMSNVATGGKYIATTSEFGRELVEQGVASAGAYVERKGREFVTTAATLMNESPGGPMLRKVQGISFTPYKSPAEGSELKTGSAVLQEVQEFYHLLNSDITVAESITDSSADVIGNAQRFFMKLYQEVRRTTPGYSSGSLALMAARTPLPTKLDGAGQIAEISGNGNLAQALILHYLNQAKIMAAARGGATDLEVKQHEALQYLTQPGQQSAALMTLIGHIPLAEQGGIHFAGLGSSQTPFQLARILTPMTSEERAEEFRTMERDPQYHLSEGEAGALTATPYRVLVDTLRDFANHELTYNEKTGLASGRLGDSYYGRDGKQTGVSLQHSLRTREGFEVLQNILTNRLGVKAARLTDKQIQQFFDNDAAAAGVQAKFIDPAIATAVYSVDTDTGRVYMPKWMYSMFRLSPKEAERVIWAQSLYAKLRMVGLDIELQQGGAEKLNPSLLKDRYVAKVYDLVLTQEGGTAPQSLMATRLLEQLKLLMDSAKDVYEIVEFFNTNLRLQREAPFSVWISDPAFTDPNLKGLGLQSTPETPNQLNIRELPDAARRLLNEDAEASSNAESSLAVAMQEDVAEYRRAKEVEKTAQDSEGSTRGEKIAKARAKVKYYHQLERLEQVIARGQMPLVLGPEANKVFQLGAMEGLVPDMASKGKTDGNAVPMGGVVDFGDHAQWGNLHDQFLANISSTDLSSILANPKTLGKDGIYFTLGDGTTGYHKVEDHLDFFLSNWSVAKYRDALSAIYLPAIVDVAASKDAVHLRQLVNGPTTLQGLVERGAEQDPRKMSTNEYTNLLNGYLEKRNPGKQTLSEIQAAYNIALQNNSETHYTPEKRLKTIDDTQNLLRNLSLEVGRLDDTALTHLRQRMILQMRQDTTGDVLEEKAIKDIPLAERAIIEERRRNELTDRLTKLSLKLTADLLDAEALPDSPSKADIVNTLKSEQEYVKHLLDEAKDVNAQRLFPEIWGPMSTPIRRYYLTKKEAKENSKEVNAKKANLLFYLLRNESRMTSRHSKQISALNHILRAAKGIDNYRIEDIDDYWNDLSSWVLTDIVHNLEGVPVTSGTNYGNVPVSVDVDDMLTPIGLLPGALKYYSMSYDYLIDMLLDPRSDFVQASRELAKDSNVRYRGDEDVRVLGTLQKMFGENKLGKWSPLVAVQTEQAYSSILTSAVNGATPRAGESPKSDQAEEAFSYRSDVIVPDELFSITRVPIGTVLDSDTSLSWEERLREASFTAEDVEVDLGYKEPETEDQYGRTLVTMPTIQLHGRLVRSVKVYAKKKDDPKAPLQPVWFPHDNGSARTDNVLASDSRGTLFQKYFPGEFNDSYVSLPILESKLPSLLMGASLDKGSVVSLGTLGDDVELSMEFDFVHANSLPAHGEDYEKYHSAVQFEGLAGVSSSDSFESLVGFKLTESGTGELAFLQANSLQAIKRLALAWLDQKRVARSKLDSIESMWATNMDEMIHQLTIEFIHGDPYWSAQADKVGLGNDYIFYNALRKRIMNQTWVRGKDASGKTRLLSAQEVIQYQLSTGGLPFDLTDAELVRPSRAKARTMFGDTSPKGLPNATTSYEGGSQQPLPQRSIKAIMDRTHSLEKWDGQVDLLENIAPFFTQVRTQPYGGRRSVKDIMSFSPKIQRMVARANEVTARQRATTSDADRRATNLEAQNVIAPLIARDQKITSTLNLEEGGLGQSIDRSAALEGLASTLTQRVQNAKQYENVVHVAFLNPQTKELPADYSFATVTNLDIAGGAKNTEDISLNTLAAVDVNQLSTLLDTEHAYKALDRTLSFLANTGAKIMLIDSRGERDYRNWAMHRLMEEYSYRKVEGNPYLLEYDPDEGRTVNEKATNAYLLARRETHMANYTLGVAHARFGNHDGSQVVLDTEEAEREVVAPVFPIPVDMNARYNLPVKTELREVEARLLEVLGTQEFTSAMVDQVESKQDKEDVRQALEEFEHYLRNTQGQGRARLLPDEFRIGTLIPLYDGQNIVFYRMGHKADWNQVNAYLAKRTNKGNQAAPYPIAILPGEVDSSYTMAQGRFRDITTKNGAPALHVEYSLGLGGTKYQGAEGHKTTTRVANKEELDLISEVGMFPHRTVAVGSDMETISSKYTSSVLSSFDKAFTLFGHDTEKHLLRAWLDVDIETLSAEEAFAQRASIRQLLRNYAKQSSRYTLVTANEMLVAMQDSRDIDILWENFMAASEDYSDLKNTLAAAGKSKLKQRLQSPTTYDEFVTKAVLNYLSIQGTMPEDIFSFAGVASHDGNLDSMTRVLPVQYTEIFATLPVNSSIRQEAFDEFNKHFNFLHDPDTGEIIQVWRLNPDWTLTVIGRPQGRKGERSQNEMYLTMEVVAPAGDSSASIQQSQERRTHDKLSYHDAVVRSMASGAITTSEREQDVTKRMLSLERITEDSTPFDFLDKMRADIAKDLETNKDTKIPTWLTWQERRAMQFGERAISMSRRTIDTSNFTDVQRRNIEKEKRVLRTLANLDKEGSQDNLIDFYLRKQMGSLVGEGGDLTVDYTRLMGALKAINTNLREGHFPSHGAEIPLEYLSDLRTLFLVNQEAAKPWAPLVAEGQRAEVDNWEDWVYAALGSYTLEADTVFDEMFRAATDGTLNSYRSLGGDFTGLTVSSGMLEQLLTDKSEWVREDGELRVASNIILDESLSEEEASLAMDQTLDELLNGPRMQREEFVTWKDKGYRQRKQWREENGMPEVKRVRMKDIRSEGKQMVQQMSADNAFFRGILNLRVAMALAQPALPVSALLEYGVYGTLSDMAEMLSGQSASLLSAGVAKVMDGVKNEDAVEVLNTLFGGAFNYDTIQHIRSNSKSVSTIPSFYRMLWSETNNTPAGGDNFLVDKVLGSFTRWTALLQDPTFGMSAKTMATRYQTAAIANLMSDPTVQESPETILRNFAVDPLYIQKNYPWSHNAGLRSLEDSRGLKSNLGHEIIAGTVRAFVNSPNPIISTFGAVGLQPSLVFSKYATNITNKVFAIQGPSALLAMALHGRRKPWANFRQGTDENSAYFNLKNAIESVDLVKEFSQSGLSLTALLAFGMLSSAWGLTGEDEEDKKRRRAARFKGMSAMRDPNDIATSWVNDKDTVFLENLPFDIGSIFSSFYQVATVDEEGGETKTRAMGKMNWILQQFLSPMMGFDRFMSSGDIRQIFWGFTDALNAFPLINWRQYQDVMQMNTALAQEIQEAAENGTLADTSAATSALFRMVMTFESMLFENSFINQLYVGQDEYDRDPFLLPATNIEREMEFDKLGNPVRSNALVTYYDEETGEIKEAYVKRADWEATMAQYSENRLGVALFASLFTGQMKWGDSTFNRNNMVVKERSFELQPLEPVEAKDLVFSLYNKARGEEVLEYDGARAILNGISVGAIAPGDPVLRGIYLSYEQREQLARDWEIDIVNEGIEVYGLSEWDAKGRMYEIFNAKKEGGVSLNDILWDKEIIPYSSKLRYKQLNTTYTIGPDGMPYATGVTRDKLLGALGLVPFAPYHGSKAGLGVDKLLNTTDPAFQLNTGMRALERVEESHKIPTQEEVLENFLKRFEDLLDKKFTGDGKDSKTNGWVNYSRGYSRPRYNSKGWTNYKKSSGSGSGYAPTVRSSTVNATRITQPRGVSDANSREVRIGNAGKATLRRASIRRERFSSEKGRLKPWQ